VLSEHIHAVVNSNPELDCEIVSRRKKAPEKNDIPLVAKLATMPVTTPRMTAAHGGMKPEAGVAATRPEMQPEHQPTMDHFFASL
jgi:hypothetical protein